MILTAYCCNRHAPMKIKMPDVTAASAAAFRVAEAFGDHSGDRVQLVNFATGAPYVDCVMVKDITGPVMLWR